MFDLCVVAGKLRFQTTCSGMFVMWRGLRPNMEVVLLMLLNKRNFKRDLCFLHFMAGMHCLGGV